jgi:hypothetical protein
MKYPSLPWRWPPWWSVAPAFFPDSMYPMICYWIDSAKLASGIQCKCI